MMRILLSRPHLWNHYFQIIHSSRDWSTVDMSRLKNEEQWRECIKWTKDNFTEGSTTSPHVLAWHSQYLLPLPQYEKHSSHTLSRTEYYKRKANTFIFIEYASAIWIQWKKKSYHSSIYDCSLYGRLTSNIIWQVWRIKICFNVISKFLKFFQTI